MPTSLRRTIQSLRGEDKSPKRVKFSTPEQENTFLHILERAEQFTFLDLPLEFDGKYNYTIPQVTSQEQDFWDEGLISLPHPYCWFEFDVEGSNRTALVVWRVDEFKTACRRIDLGPAFYAAQDFMGVYDTRTSKIEVSVRPNLDMHVRMENGESVGDAVSGDAAACMLLSIYMCLVLMSKTTETRRVEAPAKLVRSQVKRKVERTRSHTVVRIVPDRFMASEVGVKVGSVHRKSPRLHSRRSHLRHFDSQTPGSKHVEVCPCCQRENVWVTPIPRFWVNRRDDSDSGNFTTREYKVNVGRAEHA